jgi:hypothetical protein
VGGSALSGELPTCAEANGRQTSARSASHAHLKWLFHEIFKAGKFFVEG